MASPGASLQSGIGAGEPINEPTGAGNGHDAVERVQDEVEGNAAVIEAARILLSAVRDHAIASGKPIGMHDLVNYGHDWLNDSLELLGKTPGVRRMARW